MPCAKNRIPLLLTVALLAAVLLTGPALAQEGIAGSYVIRGTTPDGGDYSSRLQVSDLKVEGSLPFYQFTWDGAEGPIVGVGIPADTGYYSVVWGGEDSACSLQIFAANEDGSASAIWFDAATLSIGTEQAVPRRQGADGISGSYDVTGMNPDGSEYAGSLVVSSVGDGQYLFIWTVGGDSYTGVGFPEEGWVAVVSSYAGTEGSCGQSSFELDGAGNLSGFWWTTDPGFGVGTEVANKEGGGTLGQVRRRWRVNRQE